MKLWIDDMRPAPKGYIWLRSVNEAKEYYRDHMAEIEEIDIDHDAGDYYDQGGDYIKFLEWLEEKEFIDGWKITTKFHIHSGNPVGCHRMWKLIKYCGWEKIIYEWE